MRIKHHFRATFLDVFLKVRTKYGDLFTPIVVWLDRDIGGKFVMEPFFPILLYCNKGMMKKIQLFLYYWTKKTDHR